MVAHERLIAQRVTMERLLAKPSSFSNLPAFLDLNGRLCYPYIFDQIKIRNVLCNLGDQMTDQEANFLFDEAGINNTSLLNYRKLMESMKNTLKE